MLYIDTSLTTKMRIWDTVVWSWEKRCHHICSMRTRRPISTANTTQATEITIHPAVTNGLPKIRESGWPTVLITSAGSYDDVPVPRGSAKSCREWRSRIKESTKRRAPRIVNKRPTAGDKRLSRTEQIDDRDKRTSIESRVKETEDGQRVAQVAQRSAKVGSVECALACTELDQLIEVRGTERWCSMASVEICWKNEYSSLVWWRVLTDTYGSSWSIDKMSDRNREKKIWFSQHLRWRDTRFCLHLPSCIEDLVSGSNGYGCEAELPKVLSAKVCDYSI